MNKRVADVAPAQLNNILWRATQESTHITGSNLDEANSSLLRRPGNVGRDKGIRLLQQRVVGQGRLLREHIGTEGSQSTIGQRIGHSLIVNQRTTTSVDKDG